MDQALRLLPLLKGNKNNAFWFIQTIGIVFSICSSQSISPAKVRTFGRQFSIFLNWKTKNIWSHSLHASLILWRKEKSGLLFYGGSINKILKSKFKKKWEKILNSMKYCSKLLFIFILHFQFYCSPLLSFAFEYFRQDGHPKIASHRPPSWFIGRPNRWTIRRKSDWAIPGWMPPSSSSGFIQKYFCLLIVHNFRQNHGNWMRKNSRTPYRNLLIEAICKCLPMLNSTLHWPAFWVNWEKVGKLISQKY